MSFESIDLGFYKNKRSLSNQLLIQKIGSFSVEPGSRKALTPHRDVQQRLGRVREHGDLVGDNKLYGLVFDN